MKFRGISNIQMNKKNRKRKIKLEFFFFLVKENIRTIEGNK